MQAACRENLAAAQLQFAMLLAAPGIDVHEGAWWVLGAHARGCLWCWGDIGAELRGMKLSCCCCCRTQPVRALIGLTAALVPRMRIALLVQTWLQKVLKELPADKQDEFKAKSAPACKWLAGMAKDLQ